MCCRRMVTSPGGMGTTRTARRGLIAGLRFRLAGHGVECLAAPGPATQPLRTPNDRACTSGRAVLLAPGIVTPRKDPAAIGRAGRRRGVLTLKGSRSVDCGTARAGKRWTACCGPGNTDSNTAADLLTALDLALAQLPAPSLQYMYA